MRFQPPWELFFAPFAGALASSHQPAQIVSEYQRHVQEVARATGNTAKAPKPPGGFNSVE